MLYHQQILLYLLRYMVKQVRHNNSILILSVIIKKTLEYFIFVFLIAKKEKEI